jgi:transposase
VQQWRSPLSLKPDAIPPIPEGTARIAQAAFPHGSAPMLMRDEFGALYQDEDFADLLPVRGQPAEAPWRLALVSVLQFAEGLWGSPGGRCGPRTH